MKINQGKDRRLNEMSDNTSGNKVRGCVLLGDEQADKITQVIKNDNLGMQPVTLNQSYSTNSRFRKTQKRNKTILQFPSEHFLTSSTREATITSTISNNNSWLVSAVTCLIISPLFSIFLETE